MSDSVIFHVMFVGGPLDGSEEITEITGKALAAITVGEGHVCVQDLEDDDMDEIMADTHRIAITCGMTKLVRHRLEYGPPEWVRVDDAREPAMIFMHKHWCGAENGEGEQ